MNSYFASVEQQANPALRGRPIGVCAYLGNNGCIIAPSIEAKLRGVKTGMRVYQARIICPDIICVENDAQKYRATSKRIFSICRDYTDDIEVYSIDECFLEFTKHEFVTNLQILALEIKQRIRSEVGEWLRCSIGIAPTRWLSKFAGELQKPDGLTVLSVEDLPAVYERVKLTDAWGIGRRMEVRLNRLGIYTLNELRTYPVANLMEVMGVQGYYLWANVNGIEIGNSEQETRNSAPKSIGHSYCLPKKTNDMKYVFGVLMKLCEKTGRRLRSDGREAWGLHCAWSFSNGGGDSRHRKLNTSLWDSADIFEVAKGLLHSPVIANRSEAIQNVVDCRVAPAPRNDDRFISFLAVSVTDLRPYTAQLSLLDSRDHDRRYRLVSALDSINNRYGEYAVIRGAMWGTKDSARDRIGFRKSVEAELIEK